MNKRSKETLTEEYCKTLDHVTLRPLKLAGYLRFEIKKGRFIKKLNYTVTRSIFTIFLGNISAAYILFICAYQDEYLTVTEIFTVGYVAMVLNCTIINISFPNRNSGLKLINGCIEIDEILGSKETKFMRDIAAVTFIVLSFVIALFQILITIILFYGHDVSGPIHVVGTIYFIMVFLIFFDSCFLVALYTFLSLRVHYLNVALIKLAKIDSSYFANQLFFSGILWRKTFDKLVTFQKRGDMAQFIQVFGIIFKQLRQIEKCFRFTSFVAISAILVGTFLGVQTVILHKQLPDINILRTIAVLAWVVLGWMYLLNSTQYIDMYYRQIEKTKLICIYIQLKPIMSEKMLKLTTDLLRLLEIHEPRLSIYNLCYINTKLLLKVMASIFVYITVQLQLVASPIRSDEGLVNITARLQTHTWI